MYQFIEYVKIYLYIYNCIYKIYIYQVCQFYIMVLGKQLFFPYKEATSSSHYAALLYKQDH